MNQNDLINALARGWEDWPTLKPAFLLQGMGASQNLAQAQMQAANNARQAQWSGINPQMLQQYHPAPTQYEIDYEEGMKLANKICKEVKDWFELCDWVAMNEVNAIAPGWREE